MPPPKSNWRWPFLALVAASAAAWFCRPLAAGEPHWAFVPPRRGSPPAVAREAWPANAIDRFVLARLEARGLAPAAEADRATLARRLSLDLTGLPPSMADLDRFLADSRPEAYEKFVDALLASSEHGEHLARHWLDLARYADTHGYFTDHVRYMWPWRDWVIRACNANMPFDRFTVEQLAGDLLPDPTTAQRVATGFNRNHMITEETGVIVEEYRVEYMLDRVRTTGTAWLGLTVGCAQCHDHKYDPLSQREFYELFAFFNNVPESGLGENKRNSPPVLELPTAEQEQDRQRLDERLAAVEAKLKSLADGETSAANSERRKALEDETADLRQRRSQLAAEIVDVMTMQELDPPRDTFVLERGQYDRPRERVRPGVPAALPAWNERWPRNRLGFARWLTAPEHPLTARVAVNRLWQQVFGTGLVRTSEDFGVQGEWPTHPELLDWLAVEFVESGWNVRHVLKSIVMSATYRQSSAGPPALRAADPQNALLGRSPRHRLDAEVVRDSALAIAGLLARETGGPSVRPYQPAGLWNDLVYDKKNTQTYEQDRGAGLYRRSMYTYWKRQVPPPVMLAFDAPTRETCLARRQRTNTPLQSLALLNDPQFVECARAFAQRACTAGPTGDAARLAWCFREATCRAPDETELAELVRLLASMRAEFAGDYAAAAALLQTGESPLAASVSVPELAAWTSVCQTLLNLDETISRE